MEPCRLNLGRRSDHPNLVVPAFEGDIRPLETLNSYLGRTSGLCKVPHRGLLFISFIKPHNPASSASIARRLKSVIT